MRVPLSWRGACGLSNKPRSVAREGLFPAVVTSLIVRTVPHTVFALVRLYTDATVAENQGLVALVGLLAVFSWTAAAFVVGKWMLGSNRQVRDPLLTEIKIIDGLKLDLWKVNGKHAKRRISVVLKE